MRHLHRPRFTLLTRIVLFTTAFAASLVLQIGMSRYQYLLSSATA